MYSDKVMTSVKSRSLNSRGIQPIGRNDNVLHTISVACLILFPISITVFPFAHGLINLLLSILGLYLFVKFRSEMDGFLIMEKLFLVGIVGLFLTATFIVMIKGINEEALKQLGKFLYLLFAFPVFLFFRHVGVNQSAFWYGLAIGAVGSGLVAIWDVVFEVFLAGYPGRAHGATHPIIFGDLSLLLGAMALVGCSWFWQRLARWRAWLMVLAAVMGLLASVLSQARGGWVAIPVIVVCFLWFYYKRVAIWKLAAGSLSFIVLLIGLYNVSQLGVADRLERSQSILQQYFNTGVSHSSHGTSIGSRLEMWQASWQIFLNNPLVGVGWGNFQSQAEMLVRQGIRNPSAAKWPHPHNQFLSSLASGGVVGFIATLAVFMVPIGIFAHVIRDLRQSDVTKRLALAGLVMVISFAIFNLSESFLERSRTLGFFVFYLGFFVAAVKKDSVRDNR